MVKAIDSSFVNRVLCIWQLLRHKEIYMYVLSSRLWLNVLHNDAAHSVICDDPYLFHNKCFHVITTIWLTEPPKATLVILDNLGWHSDVANIFIRQRQIQIVPWNNCN